MVSPDKAIAVNTGEARMHTGNAIALIAATLLSAGPGLGRFSNAEMDESIRTAVTLLAKSYELIEVDKR
jgi:hypothetical protein